MTQKNDVFDHCRQLVRLNDRDRYIASFFAPDEKRPYLMALYAFNCEIAQIRYKVREAPLGEIRLQWWLDTIEALDHNTPPSHPVARALAQTIAATNLPKSVLCDLISARRFDLYQDPMPDIAALELYLGDVSSALFQLATIILCGSKASLAAETSQHAGISYGLANLLRFLPRQRSHGQCFIPEKLLEEKGSSSLLFLAGRGEEAIVQLRMLSWERLVRARISAASLPDGAFPAFLPLALTKLYLKRLEKADIHDVIEISPFKRLFYLWKAAKQECF